MNIIQWILFILRRKNWEEQDNLRWFNKNLHGKKEKEDV